MSDKISNKPIIVTAAIILAVVALLVSALFLSPIIEAVHRRNSVFEQFEGIESAGKDDMIVVSDPAAYEDGVIPTTSTAVLDGEDMTALSAKLLRVTDGAHYSETTVNMIGRLDINVALRGGDGVYTIYFTEKQFYVTKDAKAYLFDIDEEQLSDYTEFYNELYELTE